MKKVIFIFLAFFSINNFAQTYLFDTFLVYEVNCKKVHVFINSQNCTYYLKLYAKENKITASLLDNQQLKEYNFNVLQENETYNFQYLETIDFSKKSSVLANNSTIKIEIDTPKFTNELNFNVSRKLKKKTEIIHQFSCEIEKNPKNLIVGFLAVSMHPFEFSNEIFCKSNFPRNISVKCAKFTPPSGIIHNCKLMEIKDVNFTLEIPK